MSATQQQQNVPDVGHHRLDPGSMTPNQREYRKALAAAFRELTGVVRKSIDRQDLLNLAGEQVDIPSTLPGGHGSEQYLDWFEGVQDEVVPADGYGDHVDRAYAKGLVHADIELRQAGIEPQEADPRLVTDDRAAGVAALGFLLGRKVHRDAIEELKAANRRSLRGIKEANLANVAQELEQALREGESKRQIANRINSRIRKIGLRRAQTHGVTFPAVAHHEAAIERFQEFDIEEVQIKAEYVTAGDDKVCPQCEPLHGEVFELSEVRGLLPQHPRCRCVLSIMKVGS